MNNIIPQNNKNKRYLPHEIKTRIYAVEMYRNCGDIEYVCRKYHTSRTSLYKYFRWFIKYNNCKRKINLLKVLEKKQKMV